MTDQSRAADEAELERLDEELAQAENLETYLRDCLEDLKPSPMYRVSILACLMLAGRLTAHQAKDRPAMEEMIEASNEILTDRIREMFDAFQQAAIHDSKKSTHH